MHIGVTTPERATRQRPREAKKLILAEQLGLSMPSVPELSETLLAYNSAKRHNLAQPNFLALRHWRLSAVYRKKSAITQQIRCSDYKRNTE